MLWSSYGEHGYFQSVLKSDNSELDGKWVAQPMLLAEDGGHGMLFSTKEGKLKLALHCPNTFDRKERLRLFDVIERDGILTI